MNSFFRAIRTLVLIIFSLALFAGTPGFAQTFRGTILGSVTDSSGAAVPGATVTVKNPHLSSAILLDANGMPAGKVAVEHKNGSLTVRLPREAMYLILE